MDMSLSVSCDEHSSDKHNAASLLVDSFKISFHST